jgi:hypothetical protein
MIAAARANIKVPMAMHRGRWLAKYGIVKEHIDAISAIEAAQGAEPDENAAWKAAESGEVVADDELAAMLGEEPSVPLAGGATSVAPTAPSLAPTASGAVPVPPPEPGAISAALIAFGDATTLDDVEMGKRLGVSRQTVNNWITGKSLKPKIGFEQARFLLSDIDMRIGNLQRAADTLSKVKP